MQNILQLPFHICLLPRWNTCTFLACSKIHKTMESTLSVPVLHAHLSCKLYLPCAQTQPAKATVLRQFFYLKVKTPLVERWSEGKMALGTPAWIRSGEGSFSTPMLARELLANHWKSTDLALPSWGNLLLVGSSPCTGQAPAQHKHKSKDTCWLALRGEDCL